MPDAWTAGEALQADKLNTMADPASRIVAMRLSATVQSDSDSYADLMRIPVVSGKYYHGVLVLRWTPPGTSTGASFSANHPGGEYVGYVQYMEGGTGGAVDTYRIINSQDFNSGGDASPNNGNTRIAIMQFGYSCTADGYFAIRYKRVGTGGVGSPAGITYLKGSGGLVMVT